LKPGEFSQAINLGQKGAVVAMLEKTAPTDAEFAAIKNQIKASLLERKRGEAEEVFVASLRQKLDKEGRIVIDRKKVTAMAGSANSGE